MLIRKANDNDIAGMAKVNVDSWRSTYKKIVPASYLDTMSYEAREHSFEKALSDNQMIVYVAEAEEIIGYILGGKNRHIEKFPAYDGELYAIYILEEYQGKGIGKLLVSEFIDALKEEGMQTMIVQVLKENPAKMFYQRMGASYISETSLESSDKELAEEVYGWDLN